jgi:methionine--tRNA ligase beta chain
MDDATPQISIEDFAKLDIRIGTITTAELVPDTDKLVRFEIDLGNETRQIIGGFAPSYPDPSVLVGTQVPVLVNLAPRMMRGLESQGMVLAASNAEGGPTALHPDSIVPPGTKIR